MLSSVKSLRRLLQIKAQAVSTTYQMSASPLSNLNDEVLFDANGTMRVITLNRSKALNALNRNMIEKMIPNMKRWTTEENVTAIVIKGAGEKAFCAGGDIKAVTDAGKKSPNSLEASQFFRREYTLNHMIGSCPIPFVALIDGITMGGGVGLSVHAPFRVATDKTVFAMPETAIGLFPDVGGGHFMSRMSGGDGFYLALTGFRLKGEDVCKAGVATHYISHENGMYNEMKKELLSMVNPSRDSISNLLTAYHKRSVNPDHQLSYAPVKSKIDAIFTLPTLEQMYDALERDESEWAEKTLNTLRKMSPTSMKITIEQLQRGANLTLGENLRMELRMVRTIMQSPDFYEGVRALLVDKDQQPQWTPATIEEVTDERVQSYFRPMPDGAELEFE